VHPYRTHWEETESLNYYRRVAIGFRLRAFCHYSQTQQHARRGSTKSLQGMTPVDLPMVPGFSGIELLMLQHNGNIFFAFVAGALQLLGALVFTAHIL